MADDQPDPIAAVRAFLLADAAVADRTEGRVYGVKFPRSVNELMPAYGVIVAPAGGLGAFGNAYQDFGDLRVDVDCYGPGESKEPSRESFLLYLDVHRALKHLQREVHAEVLLHWARVSAKGIPTVHPVTGWPVTPSSWQVLAAEIPVPA